MAEQHSLNAFGAICRARSLVLQLYLEVLAVPLILTAHEVVNSVEECESIVNTCKLNPPSIVGKCNAGAGPAVVQIEDVVNAISVHTE